MKQTEFEQKYRPLWENLERALGIVATDEAFRRLKVNQQGDDFPENYRLICHHLSLARSRHYSPVLVARLEKLVKYAHQSFYYRRTHFAYNVIVYFTTDFPQAVRDNWAWVLLSSVLFFTSFRKVS